MRVISGYLKGRVIKGYDIDGTRPTMDRVKESVMASVQSEIEDSVVLDLFAGSGNLGIEAISNGARKCYFIDNNKKCIKAIRDNINAFEIGDKCVVMESDYLDALKKFRDEKMCFNLIFVDPPYKEMFINEVMKFVSKYRLLALEGMIVLEYQELDESLVGDDYELIKKKRYGDKFVSIYKFSGK